MTQFTLFFARLVDLIGSEKAAALVNELAGQTIQFPVAGHTAELIKRTVTPRLTILFNGVPYDVSHLQGVAVGDVITVTVADLKRIKRDDFGFPIDAPVIGSRTLQVPTDIFLPAPEIQQQILSEITNDNHAEIAKKFGLSSRTIYRIIRRQHFSDRPPLTEPEAKALTEKLVHESTRANGKKLMTHLQAAHLLRERLQFPEYIQDALQRFQQETLANHCPEHLAQSCCCLRATHSPSPEHQANLGDEGDK